MAYQALYRTFRPERFADIVAQDAIMTTLKNQILQGRIGHAYLFCGARGTGKTTTARVFARAVNCLTPKDGYEPCGECAVCREFMEERSMDFVEIDAASNNSVDEIRDLRDKVKYPPVTAKRKVYIIDEVHMLSTGAFNALLKTLEEPPEHAVFLLATTEPNRLPATILSRCQRFDFKRYSVEIIVHQLHTVLDAVGAQAEEEALGEIARAAEGCMRDALSLLDLCLSYGDNNVTSATVREAIGTSGREFLFGFADKLLHDDAAGALRDIDALMREGRDARSFGREMTGHLRNLLVVQALGKTAERDAAGILDCTQDEAALYIAQAQGADPEKLLRMLDQFMRTDSDLRWETQARTVLEMCAFLCCRPQEQLRLDALSERVAKLEKQLAEGVRIAPQAPAAKNDVQKAQQATPQEAKPARSEETQPVSGKDLWDKAAAALVEENKAMMGPLKNAIFVGCENDTVVLEFKKTNNMYMRVLSVEEKKAMIARKCTEVFGRPIQVVVRMQEDKRGVAGERTPTVQLAREVFGREKVDLMD